MASHRLETNLTYLFFLSKLRANVSVGMSRSIFHFRDALNKAKDHVPGDNFHQFAKSTCIFCYLDYYLQKTWLKVRSKCGKKTCIKIR